MIKSAHWLILVLSIHISPALAVEDLLDLYKLAEENDPQLKIAQSDRLIAAEQKPQVQANLRPSVTLSGGINESYSSTKFFSGDSFENTNANYRITLGYPLYRRELDVRLKQASLGERAAEFGFEGTKQGLMGRLAQAYFSVLAGQDRLRFAQSAQKFLKRQLEQSNQRFEVGLTAITDVQESQAAFDAAVADVIAAQNDLDNRHESLREITSNYHRELAVLKEEIPLINPEPQNIDKWTQTALDQNPSLSAAKVNVEIAQQNIAAERTANLPTVDLVANHGYGDVLRGDENPNSFKTDNNIGVAISYSLYNGGLVQARIREAQQRYTRALDGLEQARRQVQREAHNTYLTVISSISRVNALKQSVKSSETALDANITGFEVGTRTAVDVLKAQRDLLDAQNRYAQSRYDYLLATVGLKSAAGLLTLEDLRLLNELLVDPRPTEASDDTAAKKKDVKKSTP